MNDILKKLDKSKSMYILKGMEEDLLSEDIAIVILVFAIVCVTSGFN
jgi:hypothetical protein